VKTEYSHTEPYTSGRVRGRVVEQPKQEDLSSILDIIFDGWIDANQNVELGITREALAREHCRRFEGLVLRQERLVRQTAVLLCTYP
jgi:hypothetical protein